jgi:hypothetical protein
MNSPSRKVPRALLAILLLGVAAAMFWRSRSSLPWENERDQSPTNNLNAVELREQEADRTVWAKEMLAERCGRTFEILWDSINATTNKWPLLANFPFHELILPNWAPTEQLPHGIELHFGNGPGEHLSPAQWRQKIERISSNGWRLENLEFRHNRFDVDTNGAPSQSQFYFSAHLTNSIRPERAMLDGDLVVAWAAIKSGEEPAPIAQIDASRLNLKHRASEPFFHKILEESFIPSERSPFIDPLIVYDLDGDGLSEILLPAKNVVYRRGGGGQYQRQPLCRYPLEFIMTAVVADFDGDGHADLLCATSRGLFLFKGSTQGTFDDPPRTVWTANPTLKNAMVLTCGDIDEDGDLDVFLAEYKPPTLGQILRPHYYDANDSWPAYLLLNDGHGNFINATEGAGLGTKRWRRTYTASFVDLDGDGHLDLMVVSDFAGLDLYRNDGHGHFTEMTRQWVAEPHGFGMAHALADFNADGRLDLLMIGMPSPTVDRLQHLDLWRNYSAEDRSRRPAMTFGNRLYLARSNGGFEQTAMSDSIARSGWSWGCSAFDFDNDGYPDVYIANGLQSNRSVREYEPEFWLHSLFIDEAIDDATAGKYFMQRYGQTRGNGWSYGGYEKNRLLWNRHGKSFMDIGHLAGVSLEQDCRNVVADDLDGDGHVDLLVTTFEIWPKAKQTLQVYKNRLTNAGHWIGFRFHEEGKGNSPVGVRVTIRNSDRTPTRQIVTGDSHRSQHANVIHFGLGEVKRVNSVDIRWSNGTSITLHHPEIDRYHEVREYLDPSPVDSRN